MSEKDHLRASCAKERGPFATFYLFWVFAVRKGESRTDGQEDITLAEQRRGRTV